MRALFFSFAFASLLAALTGCSGKTSGDAADSGPLGSGCAVNTSLSCGGGYVAVTCAPGASPEQDDGGITCGGGAEAGAGTDYCCLSTTPPGLGCGEDGTVSCPTSGQVGYQCVSGSSPIGATSTFQCTYQSSNPADTTYSYCCTN